MKYVQGQLRERGGKLREMTKQLTDVKWQLRTRDAELRGISKDVENGAEQVKKER